MKDKRIWIVMLCCLLTLALTACGGSQTAPDTPDEPDISNAPDTPDEPDTPKTYTLTLTSNLTTDVLSSGQYPSGIGVALSAPVLYNQNGEAYQFKEWEGTGSLVILEGSKTTSPITFVMPEQDLTLTAVFAG